MDLFLSCTCPLIKGRLTRFVSLTETMDYWQRNNVNVTLSRDEGRGTPGVVWGEDVYGSMFTTIACTNSGFLKPSKLPHDFWGIFSKDEKCSSKYTYVYAIRTNEVCFSHRNYGLLIYLSQGTM